jgi:glycosyl hydrolase family 113/subtilase family protein/beta-agarase/YXIM esterase-like protein/Big-like domain-containing protein/PKD domain-containing protein
LRGYVVSEIIAVFEPLEPRLLLSGAGSDLLQELIAAPAATSVIHSAGDSYSAGGREIALGRVTDEVAIGLEPGADTSAVLNALTGPSGPLPGYTLSRSLGDGAIILAAASDAGSLTPITTGAALLNVAGTSGVAWTAPMFVNAESGLRQIAGNEVIVALAPGAEWSVVPQDGIVGYRPLPGTPDQFIVQLDSAGDAALAATRAYADLPEILWAEPNFFIEVQKNYAPNDPSYSSQWHLNNTGQSGAAPDADVDAAEAWDVTTGDSQIVVAILDDGVQTDHPDLTMWQNPGEVAGNATDDDGNGWVDDIVGWNFLADNNDPNPADAEDNHGTSVAGVAAAAGDNAAGVAGVAFDSPIMALKMATGASYATNADLASAIYYAAGRTADGLGTWDSADVLNFSWGWSTSSTVNAAFDWAAINGREGLGLPCFVATGNSASGYGGYSLTGFGAGDWIIEWRYEKDVSVSSGDDTVWLADVQLPDGSTERFDAPGLPTGWSTSGEANWTIVDDPAHAYGTGRYEAQAGDITDNETTTLRSRTVTVSGSGDLSFEAWVSSESGYDVLNVYASDDGGSSWYGPFFGDSGEPSVYAPVGYPANLSSTIAVGATTDWDYRSDYSEFGTGLDVVASSNGGYAGITTTDRTGSDGYSADDYTDDFGGTSSATPLTAGIAALMLSVDPTLTASEVRQALRDTADEIGGVTYTDGFSSYYGYGRVNAEAAVASVLPPSSGPQVIAATPQGDVAGPVRAVTVTFDKPIADGTFTLDDVVSFTGPGGATVEASAVNKLSDTQYEITFGGADLTDTDPTQTSPSGTYRWLDIADNAYAAAYKASYTYSDPGVSVQADFEPVDSSLHGTLTATGLKPNFLYQAKLVGLPHHGDIGEPYTYDSVANEQVGYSGRWWQQEWDGAEWTGGQNLNSKGDGSSPNPNDDVYTERYDDSDIIGGSPTGFQYLYEGYLPFDYFITDENGDATLDFAADSAYHVVWKTSQRAHSVDDGPIKTGSFDPDPASTEYDVNYGTASVDTFGEWERLPIGGLVLPDGEYTAQLFLTEESFHGSGGADAGNWAAAVATEIHFTIGDGPEGQYDLTIGPNIEDLVGNLMNQDGDAVNGEDPDDRYAISFTIDNTAPVVKVGTLTTGDTAPELTGTVDDPTATVSVTVDGQAYDAVNNGDGTWTLANGEITSALADGVYDVQATATDPAGNVDTDDTAGELTVSTTQPRFDFGTGASDVAAGYLRVTEAAAYSGALGYGWLVAPGASFDRLTGSDLEQDGVAGGAMTFAVDLANGTYDVVVTMGDATTARDATRVSLEGVVVDTLSTAAGVVVTNVYTVTVADGQLTLHVEDLGGTDPNAVLNSLEISDLSLAMQKGVSLTLWSETVDTGLLATSLDGFAAAGGEWVGVNVWWFQENINSDVIAPDFTRWSASDASVRTVIDAIHARGMSVMLKPLVDLSNDPTHWRGQIVGDDAWFTTSGGYADFMAHFAQIADEKGVELFCIGTELDVTVAAETHWRMVVSDIKAIYSGPLVYATNQGGGGVVSQNPAWWDALDYIGIDAYYSLTAEDDPTVAELQAGWAAWADNIEAWHNGLDVNDRHPVLFTEIGYRSWDGTNKFPWSGSAKGSSNIDQQEQADCYTAVFDEIWGQESWLAGAYWWNWEVDPDYENGLYPNWFPIQDKPAEAVLAAGYATPTVTVDPLLTNDTSPALTGTVSDNGAAIKVIVDGNTYSATNNGDTTWALPAGLILPALSAGTYDVQVVAIDTDGGVGSDVTTNELTVNHAPVADADGPYVIDEGDDLVLDGTGSTDPDEGAGDSIVAYRWDLDDDGNYNDAAGANPTALWASVAALGLGTHTISLEVEDSFGVTATDDTTLSIYRNEPVAVASATPNPAAPADTINFDGAASTHGHPGHALVAYEWDFDYDGATFDVDAVGQAPTHVYGAFGTFTAALRVTDDNLPARTDVDTIDIVIPEAVISGMLFNDLLGHNGQYDATEPLLANWTIYIDADDSGTLNAGDTTVLTDTAGAFSFGGLTAGTYALRAEMQTDWTQTAPAGDAHSVTLAPGETVVGLEFGCYKTGSIVPIYTTEALIAVETSVNGVDADTPPGPTVQAGDAVVWTYQVGNPGDFALGDVELWDDNGTVNAGDDFQPTRTGGDENGNSRLDAGEVWAYEATRIAQIGPYAGEAVATGTPVSDQGLPIADLSAVTAADASHYLGIAPAPDLTGRVLASTLPSDAFAGRQVRGAVTFKITNNGSIPTGRRSKVVIQFVMRPVGAVDDSADMLLKTVRKRIKALAPGGSIVFRTTIKLAGGLPSGSYDLWVLIDTADGVAESSESNNEVRGPRITITEPFVDLTGKGRRRRPARSGPVMREGGVSSTAAARFHKSSQ